MSKTKSKPKRPAKKKAGGDSLSMSVWAGELVPGGARRLAALICRHGGIPKHAWVCPQCGGTIQADDGGIVKAQWRYSIGCKDQQCMSVWGPSVKSVIRMWVEECEANDQDHPRCTCGRALLAGELAEGQCYCGATLKTNDKAHRQPGAENSTEGTDS